MIKEINGKNVRIPDTEIDKLVKVLDVTAEEAIQIYLEDEGVLHNAEQEALCKKAKDSGIMRTIHGAVSDEKAQKMSNSAKKPRTTKENPTKERIISDIAQLLSGYCENVNITNKSKIIEFSLDGCNFKLDLTQKRK